MSELFRKLNLGEHQRIHVLGAPAEFDAELAQLTGVQVLRSLDAPDRCQFLLAFARNRAELAPLIDSAVAAAEGDAVLWFGYPKGTSKRYRADFNRDEGWEALRAAGFDSVRQVAIDADWSALRFRRNACIGRSR
ncbi:MAG: hypothetical protein KDI37_10320 [Xanthomonadales bacterium]|nr:hypothetical protein [Xanthomonadales bacterium]MCB1642117.1 hypothetical protein [Xanthomonadales bacterium]